ncbi:oligosaccharide flippase family protein [Demequina capsici]|uniref:Oligosaccharide flippase family protein n=1 Tax=Demequina capsici TaxID=3075620 RepID=A0AA96JB92_9MICO|nr:oligosaccharide flippase family protein [Demequina sp. PMTSA13]WNM27808.1 oligosaccharide flippase family protein [Demequina sp. PMTSA13]
MADGPSLSASGARGSLVTLVSQGGLIAIQFASLVVLAHLLTPDVFGAVAVVSAIVTFATAIVFFGLPMATLQATTLSSGAASALLIINAALGFAAGLILFASAGWLAALYDTPELTAVCRILAAVPVVQGLTIQFRQHLSRDLRFGAIAVADVLGQVCGLAVAVIVAMAGGTYSVLTAQLLTATVVQALIVVAAARWIPRSPGNWRSEVKDVVRTGMHIFGMNLTLQASRAVTVPALGLVASPVAVGQYDRAQQLVATPVALAIDQMQRVVVPVLTRVRGESARLLNYIQAFQLIAAYGTSTALLVAAALGEPLVEVVLGPGWETAGVLVQLLAVGAAARALAQTNQWLFIGGGHSRAGFRLNLWAQPAIVALSLAGLPWGASGVAIASTAGWLAFWPLSTAAVARAMSFPLASLMSVSVRGALLFALPAAAAARFALSFNATPVTSLAIGIAFAITGGLLSAAVFPGVRKDVGAVLGYLRIALQRT